MKDWIGNARSTFATLGASIHAEHEREENDYYATDPKAAEFCLKLNRNYATSGSQRAALVTWPRSLKSTVNLRLRQILSTVDMGSRALTSCNASIVIMET